MPAPPTLSCSQNGSLRYLLALSHKIVTTTPRVSRRATWSAATTFAAAETPTSQPSTVASLADHRVGLLGRHLDNLIGQRGVVDAGHIAGRRHMLNALDAVVRRVGLHRDQADVGAIFA